MHLFHSPSWQALSQNSPFYSFPPDVLKPSQRHLATCGWWWWWWLEGRDGEGEQKKKRKIHRICSNGAGCASIHRLYLDSTWLAMRWALNPHSHRHNNDICCLLLWCANVIIGSNIPSVCTASIQREDAMYLCPGMWRLSASALPFCLFSMQLRTTAEPACTRARVRVSFGFL